MRTCTIDGCDNPHRARGLCNTHYGQQHQPNRHKATTMQCVVCDAEVTRAGGGGRRYGATCSEACRAALRSAPKCELPADHISRWIGQTCEWSPPVASPKPARFTTGICLDCGTWFTADTRQPIDYCSTTCAKRVGKRRRRAREHGATGEFRYSEIMRQYARQGRTCAYCIAPIAGLPEPEHVLPLSRGGRNDMSNLVAACRACNADKSDLTLDEWSADRQRRGLAPVRTDLRGLAGFLHLAWDAPTRPAHRDRPAVLLVA